MSSLDMPGFVTGDKYIEEEPEIDVDLPLTVGTVEDTDPYFVEMNTDLRASRKTELSEPYDRKLKIRELDDLSELEKFIVQTAIQRSSEYADCYLVNLPTILTARKKAEAKLSKRLLIQPKNEHATYMSLHRAAQRMHEKGIATVKKGDGGLIWVRIEKKLMMQLAAATRARKAAEREHNINLMLEFSKNPTPQKNNEKPVRRDIFAMPKNATDERVEAIRICRGIRTGTTKEDREDLSKLFTRYNDRVTDKIIALLDTDSGTLIGAEYSTRFNDIKKAAIALTKFDHAVEQSLKDYHHAALLTLTTDPKRFASMWEANRHLGLAWNKFMTWLTKKSKGIRPEYIVAYEYTKKGMIHLHAIVFMEWIAKYTDISAEWERCGQGKIVDVRGLKRTKLNGVWVWKWVKDRPHGSTADHGGAYLMKYLKKATLAHNDRYEKQQGSIQSLYWVFNKRFWSCSRRLLPDPEEMEQVPADALKEEKEDEANGFSFWRVMSEDEAADLGVEIVYRRGRFNEEPADAPDISIDRAAKAVIS